MGIRVMITGTTGMVGEGVMLECLENSAVEEVMMVNRRHNDWHHPKLKELLVPDFLKIENFSDQLKGFDACFFCAGVSSVGMDEKKYTSLTYDTTLHFAKQVSSLNPGMVFTYVSGAQTDSSEKGRLMWARVKGRTENDLMKLPFKGVYNFRPGVMSPVKGQKNLKTIYRIFVPVFTFLMSSQTLSLNEVGRAMINAVTKGYPKHILEIKDIRELAKA
jgi:uncharacterized protein YbjT (DUF2867 family)